MFNQNEDLHLKDMSPVNATAPSSAAQWGRDAETGFQLYQDQHLDNADCWSQTTTPA